MPAHIAEYQPSTSQIPHRYIVRALDKSFSAMTRNCDKLAVLKTPNTLSKIAGEPACQSRFCLQSSRFTLSLLSLCNAHSHSATVTLPCFIQLNYQTVISITIKKTQALMISHIYIKLCYCTTIRNTNLNWSATRRDLQTSFFFNTILITFMGMRGLMFVINCKPIQWKAESVCIDQFGACGLLKSVRNASWEHTFLQVGYLLYFRRFYKAHVITQLNSD